MGQSGTPAGFVRWCRASERYAVEEAQRAHDLVYGLRRQLARREMQLVRANVVERELVRRALEVEREVLDGTHVAGLGARRHVADRHVVDHPLPQQRSRFGRGMLLLLGLHERAIVPAGARARWPLPRSPQVLTSRTQVVRRIANGSVKALPRLCVIR